MTGDHASPLLRWLLRLYPVDFRRTYGDDLLRLVADLSRPSAQAGQISNRRLAVDLLAGAWRERRDEVSRKLARTWMMDRNTKIMLAVALAMALWLGYIDQKTSEVQGTLLFLLPFGFLLGFLKPDRAWRWALILGLSIPIAGAIAFALGIEPAGLVHAREVTGQPLPYTLRDVPEGLIALIPAFVSVYAGVLVRKTLAATGTTA